MDAIGQYFSFVYNILNNDSIRNRKVFIACINRSFARDTIASHCNINVDAIIAHMFWANISLDNLRAYESLDHDQRVSALFSFIKFINFVFFFKKDRDDDLIDLLPIIECYRLLSVPIETAPRQLSANTDGIVCKDVKGLRKDVGKLSNQNFDYVSALTDFDRKCSALEQENAKLTAKNNELAVHIATLKSDCDALARMKVASDLVANEQIEVIKRYDEVLTNRHKEIRILKAQIATMEQNLDKQRSIRDIVEKYT